ncbi:MAG: GNAT family N-acetyltransferase [Conexivisphaerales archaeon]
MSVNPYTEIVLTPFQERKKLEVILQESFEGWYLRHASSKLYQLQLVFSALLNGLPVGLAMLDEPSPTSTYLFYIAVRRDYRRMGIASKLVDHCISYSISVGKKEIFAAVEESNKPSLSLFTSKGFKRIGFREMSKRFGLTEAITMHRRMVVVPGECLLMLKL